VDVLQRSVWSGDFAMDRPIVVVDDDPIYIDLLRDILQDEGFYVVGCQQSAEAMKTIWLTLPLLIILDLRMEAPDAGLTLLRQLRADQTTVSIPVIVCSADMHVLRTTADELAQLNCAVIEKPFDIDTLLNVVAMQTQHADNSDPADK
jgi:two-component system sensor histidine kinase ChiS